MKQENDYFESNGRAGEFYEESSSHSDQIHQSPKFMGVRTSARFKQLPAEVAIERNLVKVPICVANSKSGNISDFVYEFPEREIDGQKCIPKLIITSNRSPLPLTQHAKVLDVLLAMFAYHFNEEGEIYFSFNEISRLLGNCLTQNVMIKEAIKRYHYNSIFFEHSWVKDKGRFTSEVFHIIVKTDLFEGDIAQTKNPGKSRKHENLHYVKFAPQIVQSLKAEFIRLFPKEAFSELDAGTYSLYKLFYAPTDREPIIRSVRFIANFLGWGNRVDRLRPWIVKHLEILREKNFILWWRKKDDCFEVCSNSARFRRHVNELRRINPIKADRTKMETLKKTLSSAKLKGKEVEEQTYKASSEIQKKIKKKQAKDPKVLNAMLLQTEAIFAELSKMSPTERAAYLSSLKNISALDKDCISSTKLTSFFENHDS